MSNSYFEFKCFIVRQDKCAMKVGTDGVLLGAWVNVSGAKRILDIGTGTGLIALMMAQRTDADITALEIDEEALIQAQENIRISPWTDKIRIERADFREYTSGEKFDIIVSNPPYFVNSLKSPDKQRSMARHTDDLTFYDLITNAANLLTPEGCLSIIIPSDAEGLVTGIAAGCHLILQKRTYVKTTPYSLPKRVLISYGFQNKECVTDSLVVELSRHVYSEDYIELTKDYYLKM